MAHAILPVAHVLDALAIVDVFAFAMAESIQNFAFVCALVRPGVRALSSYFVLFEFSIVDRSVCPFKDTTAPEKTQAKLAFVFVTIFELACSVTMIDLADLAIKMITRLLN